MVPKPVREEMLRVSRMFLFGMWAVRNLKQRIPDGGIFMGLPEIFAMFWPYPDLLPAVNLGAIRRPDSFQYGNAFRRSDFDRSPGLAPHHSFAGAISYPNEA